MYYLLLGIIEYRSIIPRLDHETKLLRDHRYTPFAACLIPVYTAAVYFF
ncbi:hypothetical protein SOVF_129810 [Spinacia oleracea]|nr:hypothetical protein SOVF_129810 [Spinacia oleracea]